MSANTLAAQLAALASETPRFRDGARVLWPGSTLTGPQDAFEALAQEIEATVLPATLRFEAGPGAYVALHVAGRRVAEVLSASGEVPEGLIGAPLEPEEPARVAQAAQLLARFAEAAEAEAEGQGGLIVRHDPPAAGQSERSNRVPVALLLQALGREAIDPDAPPCAQMRTRLGDTATAWIRLEGAHEADSGGASVDLAGLRIVLSTQLPGFLAKRREDCPSHEDPSLTLLTDVLGADQALGLAAIEAGLLLFSFATRDFVAAHKAFRRSI